ncbi:MAG: hypothetical protein WCG23_11610 [bacterium]
MAVETYRDLNILEAAKKAEKFTTLIAAVNAAGLNETLRPMHKQLIFKNLE